MQVNTIPAATPTPAAAPTQGVISTDFDTFLTMLTTQMKNQDPLNPMDSGDLAMQLATFSGVEQQVLTNDLLSSLGAQMGTTAMADLAGWVGMEARVLAPAQYEGQPVTVLPKPDTLADKAELVVFDKTGAEVQRITIAVSDDPYQWSGYGPTGVPLPDGQYSFAVDSYAEGSFLNRQ
uniref:flagellar hook capping FlgD N-terminal domain-containing protein n=1 Tax=Actibacterium sp. TaxID=1872125 RepID=UPI00356B0202